MSEQRSSEANTFSCSAAELYRTLQVTRQILMVTIYRTILEKGYLPKELPPAFSSAGFARYATSRGGRKTIATFKPHEWLTDCTIYRLALPGLDQRILRIPHPKAFTGLVGEVSKSFRRLLKKAGASRFSRSRPVYSTTDHRSIRTLVDPANISRERALIRSSRSFLLRTDISQFYPSLYTHAVGWAVDSKTREKANWNNQDLLGTRLDQKMANLQAKVSQGVPIGNDVSFLLAEIVLGAVDKQLSEYASRSFRWFDDYEIACDSREDAEAALLRLRSALQKFNLRLNPHKTVILELPLPVGEGWQAQLAEASRVAHIDHRQMLRFFDLAFEQRRIHASAPILLYTIGLLFRISNPTDAVRRIAESCITQAFLCEPGCAQKAFSLLTYWRMNGVVLSEEAIASGIERVITKHEAIGATSDVSWALAFCIDHKISLSRRAAKALSRLNDDVVAIQSLHAHKMGLLAGFAPDTIESELRNATLESPHWLAVYETVRHGFLPNLEASVASHALFGDMLAKRITFYREQIPAYAAVIHPGGAPQWVLRAWLAAISGQAPKPGDTIAPPEAAIADMIRNDASKIVEGAPSFPEVIAKLLGALQTDEAELQEEDEASSYA